MAYTTIDSPLGPLLAWASGGALTHLHMGRSDPPAAPEFPDDDTFARLREELSEYFAGTRRSFTVPLAPGGTPFEQRVWAALGEVPYGETVSYGAIAGRIDAPGSARAVGLANGRNPIAILIPCHRIVGAGGALTGYAGGLPRKRALLDLEAGVRPLYAESFAAAARTNP